MKRRTSVTLFGVMALVVMASVGVLIHGCQNGDTGRDAAMGAASGAAVKWVLDQMDSDSDTLQCRERLQRARQAFEECG